MKICLGNAAGEYISIVESDDFVDTDMFSKLYQIVKESEADIVKSNFFVHTSDKGDQFYESLTDLPYMLK